MAALVFASNDAIRNDGRVGDSARAPATPDGSIFMDVQVNVFATARPSSAPALWNSSGLHAPAAAAAFMTEHGHRISCGHESAVDLPAMLNGGEGTDTAI